MSLHLLYCYSALGPTAQIRPGPAQEGPQEATDMINGLELSPHENRVGELGWFILEKRRRQEDLGAGFQYLKGIYSKDGEGLFIRECSD